MLNNTNKWIKIMHRQLSVENGMTSVNAKYKKYLLKKLKRVETLIAFSNALNYFKLEYGHDSYNQYLDALVESEVFHTLAIVYRHKKNEERAYFAYFISQYPQLARNTEGILTDTANIIISYIEASDIYCRSNVLKALCSIGDTHGIVNVMQLFSDKANFIHHRLLAEELFNFSGNKEELALHLWEKYKIWNDNIMLGVITFITMFSDTFKGAFLPMLQSKSTDSEIRLAIIRYYKQYSYMPAQPVLMEYLNNTENYEFATEAAAALSEYPGQDTVDALTSALQSENWHVQYSAATSLVALGGYRHSYFNDLASGGSGVLQIIRYLLEHKVNEKDMNVSEAII